MKNTVIEWIKAILIGLIIFLLITIFFTFATIDGDSMQPTFENLDKTILLKERNYTYDDVIGFNFVENGKSEYHIKRIMAVPGDDVIVDGTTLSVNGVLKFSDGAVDRPRQEYKLGHDQYFVIGDHHEVSFDSRFHGPINKKDILGKVIIHYGKDADCKRYITSDTHNRRGEEKIIDHSICE